MQKLRSPINLKKIEWILEVKSNIPTNVQHRLLKHPQRAEYENRIDNWEFFATPQW